MNLYEKLLTLQRSVDVISKDGENKSDKYAYVSGEQIIKVIRPKMDELGLLLIPSIDRAELHEGTTRSGTARFLTEIYYKFTWHDVESGESLTLPWYAQGADLGGERGVGKADTYAEKTFLLKFFHVPTDKDDPDNDGRTKTGEKTTRGTAAAKENTAYYRAALPAMLDELYAGDVEKITAAVVAITANPKANYPGVKSVSEISDAALPVVYARVKKTYEARVGHAFKLGD